MNSYRKSLSEASVFSVIGLQKINRR